ncbi:hypothetical protein NG799_22035 [Laspinema sp. D1]|uniref:Uncharacterized protein n=1 Tax=Laspinema palackyanum D2a TaxID=2953684 RepID=A0ABT2MW74_9CYAN|nr:hypothetical protein [Laspinema sp. D2a]
MADWSSCDRHSQTVSGGSYLVCRVAIASDKLSELRLIGLASVAIASLKLPELAL